MTPLVVALVPPVVLAPVVLALARWLWLPRGPGSPARLVPLFLGSCLEVLLWLAIGAVVVTFMTGDWGIRIAVPLVFACAAVWLLSGIWIDPARRTARWLFLLSPPLVLLVLGVATWPVLVALWH